MSRRPHRGRRYPNGRPRARPDFLPGPDVERRPLGEGIEEARDAIEEYKSAPPMSVQPVEPAVVVVADAFWVQFAVFEPCEIAGCSAQAIPPAWALIDLESGEEPAALLCDDHHRAWVTRPRPGTAR